MTASRSVGLKHGERTEHHNPVMNKTETAYWFQPSELAPGFWVPAEDWARVLGEYHDNATKTAAPIPVDQPNEPEPLAHVERMQTEAFELKARIAGLAKFQRGDAYANLTALQQQLMQAQHGVMLAYLQILSTRINNELDLL